eukprot:2071670-Rhodomonas_salina.1
MSLIPSLLPHRPHRPGITHLLTAPGNTRSGFSYRLSAATAITFTVFRIAAIPKASLIPFPDIMHPPRHHPDGPRHHAFEADVHARVQGVYKRSTQGNASSDQAQQVDLDTRP